MTQIKLLKNTKEVIELDLEEYLRAVVPAEMPSHWPVEALKVQAVAARSYAVYAIRHPRHDEVKAHLCQPSPGLFVHCQAYDPNQINDKTDLAIDYTCGVIMTYGGDVVNALYHSDCGGHTLGNDEVWKSLPVPYLRGVSCPSINKENHYFRDDRPVNYFGHRVGLCQYGAREMAARGRSWQDILHHYYTDVYFDVIDEVL